MEIVTKVNNKILNRAPKFAAPPKPTFRSTYEEEKWWDIETQRWVEGYAGLTGRQYAYHTQGTLKTVDGSLIKPFWRDGDSFVFDEDEQARKYQEDTVIVKRREFGLTSIFGGFEPVYNAIVNTGSISLLTSADAKRVENLFSDKTMVMYENLDPYIKPKRLHERMTGYLHLGEKDSSGNVKGADSKIIVRETADSDKNAKSFETYRAKFIFLDELFRHERANIVLNSSQSCIMQGFEKKGHIVLGGSCGDNTKAGSEIGEKLWQDAENLDIRTIFIPGWMCIDLAPELDEKGKKTGKMLRFMHNGWSDKEAATEWILRTRDKLEKATDKTRYYNFIKQYPLTIEEVFEINNQGILPQEILTKASARKVYLINNPPPIMTYDLIRDPHTKKVEAKPNKRGKFKILELAQPESFYIAGTDPIPFGDAQMSEGSDFVLGITKDLISTPVAIYRERNLDSDIVFDNCELLQDYYNGAKTMLESDRGEVILKCYLDAKREDLLAKTPRNLGINFADKKHNYGVSMKGKTIEHGHRYLIKYFLHHMDKIYFMEILEEIPKYGIHNTDVLDMIRQMLFYDEYLVAKNKVKSVVKTTRSRPFIIFENGKSKRVWKDVVVQQSTKDVVETEEKEFHSTKTTLKSEKIFNKNGRK